MLCNNIVKNSISGRYHECQPLFLEKEELVIVATGSVIQFMSSVTGEVVRVCRLHESVVVTLQLHPTLHECIISASRDGDVIMWNYNTLLSIRRYKSQKLLHQVLVCPSFPMAPDGFPLKLFLVFSVPPSTDVTAKSGSLIVDGDTNDNHNLAGSGGGKSCGGSLYRLVIYDTERNKTRVKVTDMRRFPRCAALFSVDEHHYLAVGSRRKLIIWDCVRDCRGPRVVSSAESSITTITTNIKRNTIITGHEGGEISVYHDISHWLKDAAASADGRPLFSPTVSVLHWHSHIVTCLIPSAEGSLLFSGGVEGCLVIWQMSTGYKTFMPRFGSPLCQLASSTIQPRIALVTADNTVALVNTTSLSVEWRHKGLTVGGGETLAPFQPQNADRHCRPVAKIHPIHGWLAATGSPGHIQMGDLTLCQKGSVPLVGSHEVTPYNYVSKTEESSVSFAPTVSLVEFRLYAANDASSTSTPSAILVTIDVTRGEDTSPESTLRVFIWTETTSGSYFRLKAQVSRPHGSNRVTGLAIAHTKAEFATCAADGSVKIWGCENQNLSALSTTQWSCSASFTYRDCSCGGIAYSSDDSVLAVGHGPVVGLWDPTSLKLLRLVTPPSPHRSHFITFYEDVVAKTHPALLVIGSKRSLAIYDMMSMELIWQITGKFHAFAVADPSTTLRVNESKALVAVSAEDGDNNNKVSLYSLEGIVLAEATTGSICCSSLLFWSTIADALVSLSGDGDVLLFTSPGAFSTAVSQDFNACCADRDANLLGMTELTVLPVAHSKTRNNAVSATSNVTRNMFDQDTLHAPSVAHLFDSFMKDLLSPKSITKNISDITSQSFSIEQLPSEIPSQPHICDDDWSVPFEYNTFRTAMKESFSDINGIHSHSTANRDDASSNMNGKRKQERNEDHSNASPVKKTTRRTKRKIVVE